MKLTDSWTDPSSGLYTWVKNGTEDALREARIVATQLQPSESRQAKYMTGRAQRVVGNNNDDLSTARSKLLQPAGHLLNPVKEALLTFNKSDPRERRRC